LVIQHNADLIMRQVLLYMAIRQGMKVGIPLPDTYVVNHRWSHGLACRVEARGNQASAHDPPGVIVLSPVFILHLGCVREPVVPAPGSILHDLTNLRDIAIKAEARRNIQQQRLPSFRCIKVHMDGLVICAESIGGMRNDFCVGRIRDIATDIPCQTKHTSTAVGLNFIQIGIEFNCALGGWQCDQHCFGVYKSQRERSDAGFTVNTMRVTGQLNLERLAFSVGKNPLIDEGWALPIGGELTFAFKPTFRKPNSEIIIGLKYQ
jgi:hypothetical protein